MHVVGKMKRSVSHQRARDLEQVTAAPITFYKTRPN